MNREVRDVDIGHGGKLAAPGFLQLGVHHDLLEPAVECDGAAQPLERTPCREKDLLRELTRSGCTVILTTHILEVAEQLVDRVGIMQAGKLVAEGSLEQLRFHTGQQGSTLEDLFLQLVAS